MLVQRLDLSASPQGPSSLPSVLAPPAAPAASIAGAAAASSSASANVTSAAAPDAAAPNIGAETAAQEDVEFGSVPASIHRSHFHQNKASATAPSVDSADVRIFSCCFRTDRGWKTEPRQTYSAASVQADDPAVRGCPKMYDDDDGSTYVFLLNAAINTQILSTFTTTTFYTFRDARNACYSFVATATATT